MGIPVIIYGKSGTGKSRSLKNFDEDEIFLVNVEHKPLPFRRKFKYTFSGDNLEKIKEGLSKMPTKTAVVDDAGYILTNIFMERLGTPKAGASTYDLYNAIGKTFWNLFEFIKKSLAPDVIVYIIMHEDTTDSGKVKLKMLGRLLEEKVCVEGMVTICLRCVIDDKNHCFITNSDGNDISKSPEDMFEAISIANDLKAVDTTIRNYYEV